jgi:hypothetical protein
VNRTCPALTGGAFSWNREAAKQVPRRMSTREIYRAAGVLVEGYGAEHAPVMAATRCIALHHPMMWTGVLRALEEIARTKRNVGEQVN